MSENIPKPAELVSDFSVKLLSRARHEAKDAAEDYLRENGRKLLLNEKDKLNRARDIYRWSAMFTFFFMIVIWALLFTKIGEFVGFQAGWLQASWINEPLVVDPVTGDPIARDPTQANAAVLSATRNMITVLGPILIGLVIWLVSSVAERRLKAYDETIEKLRDTLESRFSSFRDSAEKRYEGFATDLAKQRRDITQDVERGVEKNIGSLVGNELQNLRKSFEETVASFKESISDDKENIASLKEEIEKRFGHIADRSGYSREGAKIGPLTSVGAVRTMVARLFGDRNREEAVLLVQELLHQFNTGTSGHRPAGSLKGDWFNLSAVLGKNDEESLALEVCLSGLSQQNACPIFDDAGKPSWQSSLMTPDADVVAHAIQYAQTISDPRLSGLIELNGYNPETQTGRSSWGWRSYSFTLKALASLGRIEEAIALGRSFLSTVPIDADTNKVVQDLGTVMYESGDRKGAVEFTRKWLSDNPNAQGPQAIASLIDWIDGQADDAEIINLASRGIRDSAEEQASTSLSNLYFRRALAEDRRALRKIEEQGRTDPDDCIRLQAALEDYGMARKTSDPGRKLHDQQIAAREFVLRQVLKDGGCNRPTPDDDEDDDMSGPSGELHARLSSVLELVLTVLTDDAIEPEEKAELLKTRLAEVSAMERAILIANLKRISDDADTPQQLRRPIAAVMPLLDLD